MDYIKDKMSKWLWYFGYAACEGNDKTGFVTYENPTDEMKKWNNGFRKANERSLALVVKRGGKKGPQYEINKQDVFDLFPPADGTLVKVQEPSRMRAADDLKKGAEKLAKK